MDKVFYKLKRVRTKSIKFFVKNGIVSVTAPSGLPATIVDFYVQKNAAKINESLTQENFKAKDYLNGEQFDLFDCKYEIRRTGEADKITVCGSEIVIPIIATKKEIEVFYKRKLLEEIFAIISEDGLDLDGRKIVIKQYDSKWGSCSQKTLSFNLKLALVPRDVIKYVVVHEFAHITHPNHSREFWNFVASQMRDYKQHRKWLRINGNKLVI